MTEIYILIGVILVLVIFIFIFWRKEDDTLKKDIELKISSISSMLNEKNTLSLNSALIESDKLLDYVLKVKNLKGATMGERLKNAKNLYEKKTYNNIWHAHKLRNRLVHEVNINVNPSDLIYNTKILLDACRKLI